MNLFQHVHLLHGNSRLVLVIVKPLLEGKTLAYMQAAARTYRARARTHLNSTSGMTNTRGTCDKQKARKKATFSPAARSAFCNVHGHVRAPPRARGSGSGFGWLMRPQRGPEAKSFQPFKPFAFLNASTRLIFPAIPIFDASLRLRPCGVSTRSGRFPRMLA